MLLHVPRRGATAAPTIMYTTNVHRACLDHIYASGFFRVGDSSGGSGGRVGGTVICLDMLWPPVPHVSQIGQ